MNSVDHLFRQLKSPSEADYSVAVRILEKIETSISDSKWFLIKSKDKDCCQRFNQHPISSNQVSIKVTFSSSKVCIYDAFADFMT